ncbi:MAG TPA: hydroxymethylglutaryl-CoA reductase, degradative [Lactobacillus sp.]|nr:hydroxymethylglutaryl-CoA reductase, degradative [Lactobacillus sp.]
MTAREELSAKALKEQLTHFRELTWQQRLTVADQIGALTSMQRQQLSDNASEDDALLTENYLTSYDLPEGLAATIRMNGHDYLVPMVTEEPSVIAAASYGGKMAASGDGIVTRTENNLLMGQIVFQTVTMAEISRFVTPNASALLALANQAHPSIVKYGGGARKLRVRALGEGFVSVDLFVDTGEAMGANMMNGMLEALGHHLQDVLEQHPVMSILANDGQQSLVTAAVNVPVGNLAKQNAEAGLTVAKRIVAASQIAQLDVSRAVTHNKGIMNGVDAVVLATGNDWRAVEASAHAYAAQDDHYRGLSRWQLNGNLLVGSLTMPMHLGIVGGATASLPLAKINQQIIQIQDVATLNQLVVALGLAQNLAALRALVSEGIQKGHMQLQFRNLAVAAGATPAQVPTVVAALKTHAHPSATLAKAIVTQLNSGSTKDY